MKAATAGKGKDRLDDPAACRRDIPAQSPRVVGVEDGQGNRGAVGIEAAVPRLLKGGMGGPQSSKARSKAFSWKAFVSGSLMAGNSRPSSFPSLRIIVIPEYATDGRLATQGKAAQECERLAFAGDSDDRADRRR